MFKDAEAKRFDLIVAEDLDRLTRDMEENSRLRKQMDYLVIEIHTASDGRVNKLAGAFKGIMSDIFLDQLADKTCRGMIGAFDRGGFPGGRCFGYAKGSAPGQRVIDDREAVVVRRIFEEFASGISPLAIVTRLNAEGVENTSRTPLAGIGPRRQPQAADRDPEQPDLYRATRIR